MPTNDRPKQIGFRFKSNLMKRRAVIDLVSDDDEPETAAAPAAKKPCLFVASSHLAAAQPALADKMLVHVNMFYDRYQLQINCN
jgi:hypothetical protein